MKARSTDDCFERCVWIGGNDETSHPDRIKGLEMDLSKATPPSGKTIAANEVRCEAVLGYGICSFEVAFSESREEG